MDLRLDDIKKIYFLGIGGIGMSALARYFRSVGAEVHGYDKTRTPLTGQLEEEGMQVHYGEADLAAIPPGLDLVVWTPAIPRDFRELVFFQGSGLPLKKRAEVLGIISRSRRTIAVAGTHGKTTTTSLLTHLLRSGGVDCTAFLGGISQSLGSNYVGGKSDWVVAEADEYDRSFLHLSPEIAVLLSMDPDHLDIYGDPAAVAETGFKEFIRRTKPNGKVFINSNLVQNFENQLFETFGLEQGGFRAENVRVEDGWFCFDYAAPPGFPERMEGLRLSIPGRHNVENAAAAIAVALQLGVEPAAIREALASFRGIKRRFEFIYRDERRVYIDDYAHHPAEIRAAVQAARDLFPGRKLTGIFQPHLYSRTRDFQDGFAEELDKLDEVILLDIYPARELPIPGVSSAIIFDKMKNRRKRMVPMRELPGALDLDETEVLMTIGAGDIDTLVGPVAAHLRSKNEN